MSNILMKICFFFAIKIDIFQKKAYNKLYNEERRLRMISSAPQESMTDNAERRIYKFLKENNYQPGDGLPKEQEFADMLEMSRPIVREALSRFRMLGILQSRKRRGLVFSHPSIFNTLNKIIDPAFMSQSEQQEFYNLRVIIELGLSEILAFSIEDKDIGILEEIVKREESRPDDYELYLECDYEFHLHIYKSSKCSVLESFQTLLFRNFPGTPKVMKSLNFKNRFIDPNQCSHRDVLESIKIGIPDVIHATIKRHLEAPLMVLKKSTMGA